MNRMTVGLLAVLFVTVAAAHAAPSKSARVAFVTSVTPAPYLEAFRGGLRDHGWKEGENVVLDVRSANGDYERVAVLAAEAVAQHPDVLVLTSSAVHVAKRMAGSTPVVFVIADDPVRAGLVTSLAHPGGTITGITSLNVELDAKRLELITNVLPGNARVGVLMAPRDSAHADRTARLVATAKTLGIQLHMMNVERGEDVARAFDSATRARVNALMLVGAPLLLQHQAQIVEQATRAKLPLIAAWSEFVDAGGLMSYGTNVPAMFRRAATTVDRVLRGAKPSDIPVERATTFELVINRRTARSLRLDIPTDVVLRADRVLQ